MLTVTKAKSLTAPGGVDKGLGLTFGELRASDLAARARAYGTLRGAEMDAAEARRHTGLDG